MSNISHQWLYYAGLLLVFLGVMIAQTLTVPTFIIGSAIFGIGFYLCFFGDKLRQGRIRMPPPEDSIDAKNRNISTDGGNYNEQIYGDYINIQGNQICIGQEFSRFTTQIQELLNQLQNQGYDAQTAEKQVINDLKMQIRRNSRIKTKLLKWKKYLGVSTSSLPNEAELAERVVKVVTENYSKFSINSIYVAQGKFKKLYELLETSKWKEADEETVKLIYSLMPARNYTYIDINQIPPKDLRRIDKLWVKFSNGRFGLSVQKSIWIKILKAYHSNENKYWVEDSAYNTFIDCVGWLRESDRIYHGEIKYSLKAPRGHLPAILMFTNPYYFYPSNYYYLDKSIFDKLMEREYYKIPFIPSWLEDWLFID